MGCATSAEVPRRKAGLRASTTASTANGDDTSVPASYHQQTPTTFGYPQQYGGTQQSAPSLSSAGGGGSSGGFTIARVESLGHSNNQYLSADDAGGRRSRTGSRTSSSRSGMGGAFDLPSQGEPSRDSPMEQDIAMTAAASHDDDAVPVMGVPVGNPVPELGGITKFIIDDNGVRRLNPAYIEQRERPPAQQPAVAAAGGRPSAASAMAGSAGASMIPMIPRTQPAGSRTATTVLSPGQALPVCSNLEECSDHLTGAQMASAVFVSHEIMRDRETTHALGLDGDGALQALGAVFAKYETPMGLVNKLLLLTDLDAIEFIVDDSGSMLLPAPPFASRWREVQHRLKEMLEVMAHIPLPPVTVHFLNQRTVLRFERRRSENGRAESPAEFYQRCAAEVDQYFFQHKPLGTTPALEAIVASLERQTGKAVSRYFVGDGLPDGGIVAQHRIAQLLRERREPARNPFTFISCTEDDEATEWMKECEEVAPYCAEYDDFVSEAREVLHDQGGALPYTRGMYLISQLVAAMCPEDLDALDESVPLPRKTLENLLGYKVWEPEYTHYFNGFIAAQHEQRLRGFAKNEMDRVKRTVEWRPHYEAFRTAPNVSAIPAVQDFRTRLHDALESVTARTNPSGEPGAAPTTPLIQPSGAAIVLDVRARLQQAVRAETMHR